MVAGGTPGMDYHPIQGKVDNNTPSHLTPQELTQAKYNTYF